MSSVSTGSSHVPHLPVEVVARVQLYVARTSLASLLQCMLTCRSWSTALHPKYTFLLAQNLGRSQHRLHPRCLSRCGPSEKLWMAPLGPKQWVWPEIPLFVLADEFGWLDREQERILNDASSFDSATAPASRSGSTAPVLPAAAWRTLAADFKTASGFKQEAWGSAKHRFSSDRYPAHVPLKTDPYESWVPPFACPLLLKPLSGITVPDNELQILPVLLARIGFAAELRSLYGIVRHPIADEAAIVDLLALMISHCTITTTPGDEREHARRSEAARLWRRASASGATAILVVDALEFNDGVAKPKHVHLPALQGPRPAITLFVKREEDSIVGILWRYGWLWAH
ncbi:hypothetical protein BDZ88DRAFT_410859 [Geranomyces variabilis]|nr:hypothetical protein BDZ88DRAFT_410859 [Geranomyces variabilis]KAJ3137977.1 hypothetical protein HDU90_001452 [Geranomyces variabilis]